MNNRHKILVYSNLAFQMGVIIGIGTYLGNYLDKIYNNDTPWITLILSIMSIFLSFYQVLKTLKKDV